MKSQIPAIKSHKTNISPILFYIYLVLIFLFIMIYSINFLVSQFIEKENLIWSLVPEFEQNNLIEGTPEWQAAYDRAKQVWNLWSVPSYITGISTIFIFFIFVMFGRTKVRYGYFFRTIWSIVFIGAGIFVFFINGMPMWQKVINFIILFGLIIATLWDLLRVNRKREDIKFEIRNEWRNKQNNKDAREVK